MDAIKYHAITKDIPKQLVFDAGVLYRNFVSPSEPGEIVGATRGGSEFNFNPEIREVEVDGVPGPVKGFKRVVRIEATITINMLSLTKENLKHAIAGGVVEDGGEDFPDHEKITAKQIDDDSYLDNLTLVAKTGNGKPVIFMIENALSNDAWGVNTEDQNEANPAATFLAHFDPEKLEEVEDPMDAVPFAIYWPKGDPVI